MRKTTITLHDGLLVGDKRAKSAVIREGTLRDTYLASGGDVSPEQASLNLAMRRVLSIGELNDPPPESLMNLTATDWMLCERAMSTMDEGTVTEMVEAKLLPAPAGGRKQPGDDAPGAG